MDIVFHNPHSIWFKENVECHFAGVKSINKYDYLFDYIYLSDNKISVLLDSSQNTTFLKGPFRLLNNPVIEFYAWVLLNKLNPFKFKVIKRAASLESSNIIFTFLYGPFTYLNAKQNHSHLELAHDFGQSKAFKIAHLSHYCYSCKLGAINSNNAQIDLFIGENNLYKNSSFFRHYFNWYKKDVLTVPFVAQKRFKSVKLFGERLTKALSTGSNTHKMTDPDFLEFYEDGLLQPMRKTLIDHSLIMEPYVDFLINDLQSETHSSNAKNSSKPSSGGSRLFNYFFCDLYRVAYIFFRYVFKVDRKLLKNESNYYKVDIVEKYNSYKMFIVPEEVIGLPGIGFVEGISCGCAYIGLRDPMYQDLGLIDGVHYIGYDGTIDDLISKISYYQEHGNELEKIASSGYNFVTQNFNEEKVAHDFFTNLYEQARSKTFKND